MPESLSAVAPDASRFVIVYDATVAALYKSHMDPGWRRLNAPVVTLAIPSGERHKTPKTLLSVIDFLLAEKIDRNAVVVGVGGGVTTDIAGAAAALALRGVRWVSVPTTLLGMVDASIGGKTGVNSSRGKNLIGAFWNPLGTLIAPAFVYTQSRRAFADGLAEALKHFAIAGEPSLRSLDAALTGFPEIGDPELSSLIARAVCVKARIVTADEREAGVRAHLNFGHTLGHAIERADNFRGVSHGRAVAAGIVGALWLSRQRGLAETPRLASLERLAREIAGGGRVGVTAAQALEYLVADKKRRGGAAQFVLLREIGRPYLVPIADRRSLRRAMDEALAALAGPALVKRGN
ncbi:MAG TPA: 3-dehydroquinate synthase family protein [candidate division Zixibacteria bacterium]|nr:3-dehydroquinate synthase family protein [candidate division Zixibacteria bacterium]